MREVPPDLAAKLESAAAHLAGVDDVRVEDIARASGIPRATLYYYFAGKDDILAFLLEMRLDGLARRVAAIVAGPGDIRTRLQGVLGEVLELPVTAPELSHLLLLNLGKLGKLPDISAAFDQAVLAPLRVLLQEGVGTGELEELEVTTAATAIFGAATIAGLGAALLHDGPRTATLTDDVVRLVWNGIVRR